MGVTRNITGFIRYYFAAVNEHGIHSPFVFRLLTEAVYLKGKEPSFETVEAIRSQLLADTREIAVTDLGAGSTYDGTAAKRKVSDMTRRFAKSKRYGRLLYRIVQHLKPSVMLELGTSLGISTLYQAMAHPDGTVYTVEGCENTAAIAAENFRTAGTKNIKVMTGNFDDVLPGLLQNLRQIDYAYIDGNHTYEATMRYFRLLKNHIKPTTLLIFDDIHWSDGMKKAWDEIRSDKQVTITIDFFAIGLVFFNPDFSKQDFVIRY